MTIGDEARSGAPRGTRARPGRRTHGRAGPRAWTRAGAATSRAMTATQPAAATLSRRRGDPPAAHVPRGGARAVVHGRREAAVPDAAGRQPADQGARDRGGREAPRAGARDPADEG